MGGYNLLWYPKYEYIIIIIMDYPWHLSPHDIKNYITYIE